MTATRPGDVVSAAQGALDMLTAALGRADLDGLLESEARVAGAAAALGRIDRQASSRSPELRGQLEALHLALVRCRRVGGSLADVLRVARAALGAADDTYGPRGSMSERATPYTVQAQG